MIAKVAVQNTVYTPITNAILLFVSGVLGNNPEDDKRCVVCVCVSVVA